MKNKFIINETLDEKYIYNILVDSIKKVKSDSKVNSNSIVQYCWPLSTAICDIFLMWVILKRSLAWN